MNLPMKLGKPTGVEMNALTEGARVEGNLECKGDLRMDGSLRGDLKVGGRFVLGANGIVNGQVACHTVHVFGTVEGNVSATDTILLAATARVTGDITAPKLVVEEGAQLTGRCTMQALRPVYAGDAHAKTA